MIPQRYWVSVILLLLTFGCSQAPEGGGTFLHFDDSQLERGRSYHVFLLLGQSNMLGAGEVTDLLPQERTLPGTVTLYDYSLTSSLAPQSRSRFGPEVTLAHRLTEHFPDENILIVKFAAGGSSILQWQEQPQANSAFLLPFHDLYPNLKSFLDGLERRADLHYRGCFWMQGETDAKDSKLAEVYSDHLRNLINALRRDTHELQLPFIAGRISNLPARFSEQSVVRSAQKGICDVDRFAAVVDTDDLEKKSDDVHFDSEGVRKLGNRFADAFALIEMEGQQPTALHKK